MNISIFGSGYVGLVTAACLADVGNQVVCVDVDKKLVAQLNLGHCSIHEPGLQSMLEKNLSFNRLHFTTSAKQAIERSYAIYIAVGTPACEDGSVNLSYVNHVAEQLGTWLTQDAAIIVKSTVPVGTGHKIKKTIKHLHVHRNIAVDIDVVSNPEFLREGRAISDFMKPDRIIIGVDNERSKKLLHQIYEPFNRNHNKIITMDPCSAELTKYAANAMLATKISFMNEISELAEKLDADINLVRHGLGSDPRIGRQFIYPGCGYGGSCFPKDVKALIHMGEEVGINVGLTRATHKVNENQKTILHQKILNYYHGDICGKHFALWGLAFKPDTDDIREAPSQYLIKQLITSGATVCAFDPQAIANMKRKYHDEKSLFFSKDAYSALVDADALIIVTEWMEFRSPDFILVSNLLKDNVIFDGRNLYSQQTINQYDLDYICIGKKAMKKILA